MLDSWDLPGPATLRERIHARLRDGGVLILGRSASSIGGAETVLERLAGNAGISQTRMCCHPGASPSVQIQETFSVEIPPGTLLNAEALVKSGNLQGWCILLEGVGGANWPTWKHFLLEFQHACRQVRADERGTLCCIVDASEALEIPGVDINLTVELLDAWIGELDLLEYALHRLQDQHVSHPLLLAQLAAAIALWDLPLLEALLDAPEDACLGDPTPFLMQIAADRCWTLGLQPSPGNGGCNPRTKMIHSCFLALQGASEELESRRWSGQIGHFLPLLEQFRRRVLPEVARHIRLPVTNQHGERCSSHLDLDLGDICHFLGINRAPSYLVDKLQFFRQCRNNLAHLRPLVPAEIRRIHSHNL